MDPNTPDTLFTTISLIASIASLALAVLAIWIALYGKREAEKTNEKTRDLLTEVRSDAKSIAQYAIPELKAYGDSVRKFAFQQKKPGEDSEPLTDKVEAVLSESIDQIRGEIEAIKKETDVTSVRQKLDNLERQLQTSIQGPLTKEVEDFLRIRDAANLEISLNGDDLFAIPSSSWSGFLDYLYEDFKFNSRNYGKTWVALDAKTRTTYSKEYLYSGSAFENVNSNEKTYIDIRHLGK